MKNATPTQRFYPFYSIFVFFFYIFTTYREGSLFAVLARNHFVYCNNIQRISSEDFFFVLKNWETENIIIVKIFRNNPSYWSEGVTLCYYSCFFIYLFILLFCLGLKVLLNLYAHTLTSRRYIRSRKILKQNLIDKTNKYRRPQITFIIIKMKIFLVYTT